jgi:hypothetical protein
MLGRLGRLPARHDERTLQMAKYFQGELHSAYAPGSLPPLWPGVDWTKRASPGWGMMLNDQLGDCTCAGIGHYLQAVTSMRGAEVTLPDWVIEKAYEDVGGYKPGDSSTDNGAVELDVMNYCRKPGNAFGYVMDAFMSCEPKNRDHIRAAIELFGGCYLGIALPQTAQQQTGADQYWCVVPGAGSAGVPGSWGGHAVIALAHNKYYVTVITWGQPQRVTWGFLDTYCDEAYGMLWEQWCPTDQLAPNGFDYKALKRDLTLIKN